MYNIVSGSILDQTGRTLSWDISSYGDDEYVRLY